MHLNTAFFFFNLFVPCAHEREKERKRVLVRVCVFLSVCVYVCAYRTDSEHLTCQSHPLSLWYPLRNLSFSDTRFGSNIR